MTTRRSRTSSCPWGKTSRKHFGFGAGLAQGLGSVATGIAAGVGLAVAAPVAGAAVGAKKAGVAGGVAGGMAGVLAGVVGLVIAPVYGIGRGTYVAAQGLVETPGYIKGAQRCSRSNKGLWRFEPAPFAAPSPHSFSHVSQRWLRTMTCTARKPVSNTSAVWGRVGCSHCCFDPRVVSPQQGQGACCSPRAYTNNNYYVC